MVVGSLKRNTETLHLGACGACWGRAGHLELVVQLADGGPVVVLAMQGPEVQGLAHRAHGYAAPLRAEVPLLRVVEGALQEVAQLQADSTGGQSRPLSLVADLLPEHRWQGGGVDAFVLPGILHAELLGPT